MQAIPGLTRDQAEEAKALLANYDSAMESQGKGSSDAKLIVMANYGDLAANYLRAILKAAA